MRATIGALAHAGNAFALPVPGRKSAAGPAEGRPRVRPSGEEMNGRRIRWGRQPDALSKKPQNAAGRMPERGSVTVLFSNVAATGFVFIADVPVRYAMMSHDTYRPAGHKSPWLFAEFL